MDDVLLSTGKVLSDTLNLQGCRVVFAESCTAGLVSAALSRIPGISSWHCGSAVTYRNDTKHQWLGVSEELLYPPGPGPVSEAVARAMALGVLEKTPEAQIAASVTGHLGPNAPIEQDGEVWLAVASRDSDLPDSPKVIAVKRLQLDSANDDGLTIRETRQQRAAIAVLELVIEVLRSRRRSNDADDVPRMPPHNL